MPAFDNIDDAFRFLNEQLGRFDARLLKVEGENLALRSVVTMLRGTMSAEDRAFFAEKAVDLANEVHAVADDYDDNTRRLIAAYVETLNSLLLPSEAEPDKPAFSVISGGKGNSE